MLVEYADVVILDTFSGIVEPSAKSPVQGSVAYGRKSVTLLPRMTPPYSDLSWAHGHLGSTR